MYKRQNELSRQEKQQDNVPQKISSSLLDNLVYLRKQFDGSMDFIIRQFNIEGTKAALITIDNLIDKQTIAESILNPIRRAKLSHLKDVYKRQDIMLPVMLDNAICRIARTS